MIFLGQKLAISLYKKSPKQQHKWSRELFGKFPKESPHLEEEKSYEITKKFLKDVGRFLAFFF
jgi:hypothetical protein